MCFIISARRLLAVLWNLGYIAIFGPLEQLSPQLQILCKFAHLYTMKSGIISLLGVETNSAYINSEKSTTKLNGPHYSEFEKLRI
jgi:hypothetical protein